MDEYNKNQQVKLDSISRKGADIQKINDLSKKFQASFRGESPNYNSAFIQALELEEMLDEVPESSYPQKRADYARLGEAYYLFNDFEKSISVLKKALSEHPPLSFTDRADLDARKIIGICYANINRMDSSDYYFRSILESPWQVLNRPLYNAYALSYLGCNAMIKGEYEKALALDGAVLPFFRAYTDYGHLAGMYYCRFNCYEAMGDTRRAGLAADSILYYANKDTYHPNKRRKQAFTALSRYNAAVGNASLTKAYGDSLVTIYRIEESGHTSQYIANALQVKQRRQAQEATEQAQSYRRDMFTWLIVSVITILLSGYIFIQYRRLRKTYRLLVEKSRQWAEQIAEDYRMDTKKLPGTSTTEEAAIMRQVHDYVITAKNYLDTELSLDKLSKELNINRSYLSSAVNNVMGKNFNAYVNEYRISEAIRLLNSKENNQYTINDVFIACGFNNKRSFYIYFKKITGITPGEYRENQPSEE